MAPGSEGGRPSTIPIYFICANDSTLKLAGNPLDLEQRNQWLLQLWSRQRSRGVEGPLRGRQQPCRFVQIGVLRLRCRTQIGVQYLQMQFADFRPIRLARIVAARESADSEAIGSDVVAHPN